VYKARTVHKAYFATIATQGNVPCRHKSKMLISAVAAR